MAVMICPYLGIQEDAETAVAFPSPRNRCFRSGSAAVVSTVQQDNFCLRDTHMQCPVFQLKQQLAASKSVTGGPGKPAARSAAKTDVPAKAAQNQSGKQQSRPTLPPKQQPASAVPAWQTSAAGKAATGKQPSKTRRMKDTLITGLMGGGIMAILLAAVLILPAYGSRIFGGGSAMAEQPTETIEQQAGVISQPSVVFIVPSNTATATAEPTRPSPTTTATKKPTAKPSPTRTPTKRPTATSNARIPPTITSNAPTCGVPYGWVLYIVQHGDTLTSLSQRTNTSVYQLQTANCLGNSTLLYTGMNFYLPFIPAPVYPTQRVPSNTPVPTSTSIPAPTRTTAPSIPAPTRTTAPSNTPVPVQPSATPVPPTVEPSPVVPTNTPVTPPPATVEATAGSSQRGER